MDGLGSFFFLLFGQRFPDLHASFYVFVFLIYFIIFKRCGAGTNNVPVARMTELGIPVFNTPGANANSVKELVLCGMLLGSRRIVDGINHMKQLGRDGLARERVEKDKAMFGGQEIKGKTLAVLGLGKLFLFCVGCRW